MQTRSARSKFVHGLFKRDRFPAEVDYNTAFYDAAILATRLMNSPQALQHDYCFYFGTATPLAQLPPGVPPSIGPEHAPVQYTCNKGVGELNAKDIQAVNAERDVLASRIRFEVVDLANLAFAECNAQKPQQYAHGYGSIVSISRRLYDAAANREKRTPENNARVTFLVATTLIHELAHAPQNYRFGTYFEHYREVSIVAEARYELEARIFGMKPNIHINLSERDCWETWQSHEVDEPNNLREVCRDISKLPQQDREGEMEDGFIMKLLDDDFWSGEYVRLGAVALLPEVVANYCRKQQLKPLRVMGDVNANVLVPQSITDLFRCGGPSYAKVLYPRSCNTKLVLRGPPTAGKKVHVNSVGNKLARDDSSDENEAKASKNPKAAEPANGWKVLLCELASR